MTLFSSGPRRPGSGRGRCIADLVGPHSLSSRADHSIRWFSSVTTLSADVVEKSGSSSPNTAPPRPNTDGGCEDALSSYAQAGWLMEHRNPSADLPGQLTGDESSRLLHSLYNS